MNIFRKENINKYLAQDHKFSKTLTAKDLISLGVGAVIGTGIFILPGTVAANYAGPGVTLSFLLAALVCVLSAMAYAEFSSTMPVAGSAYSYGNIIYGEIIGWILGWALILEYMLAVAAVAAGWSSYFQSFLAPFNIKLPAAFVSSFNPSKGTYVDIIAIGIVLLITLLLSRGMRDSVKINNFAVILKIAIIVLFIIVGANFIKPANYQPFLPYHFSGVIKGATTVFFAFLGFDCVSSSAAEVKNPQKNMPLGIIGTLLIATLFYMGVSIVLTGMVNYKALDVANPVAFALQFAHQDWIAQLLSFGALVGMATMMLTMIYASSRLVYAMARDGLLPQSLAKLSTKNKTPQLSLWVVAIVISLGAGVFSVDQLTSLVNFGTLLAFTFVSFGILPLRKRKDLPNNGYQMPGYPILPILSGLICLYLLTQLNIDVYIMAAIWFSLGIIIYFLYGYKHSLLNKNQ
ncbi:APC family permease [Lactobacillus mulieris]|uniref:Amino acid permease n=2 Tax=Lactobacillales TaxID=186826 RepID=A0AAW5WYE1_9LACO|nr:amino acid permease [Lactobacillus mulieris]MCZ3622203.1 amino acid permease [Lactobacillus mulieris]MCZ3624007.1 amino acid permease [Lactobacillus mulieris]MCZ3636210.1 amino acid permease [Lactobacillus mulieris]MCZ3689754.1 amino acid permease [Lactobacillus mulieris]MCZ3695757.1 amino acid permease [Lactobacillus mulieris]